MTKVNHPRPSVTASPSSCHDWQYQLESLSTRIKNSCVQLLLRTANPHARQEEELSEAAQAPRQCSSDGMKVHERMMKASAYVDNKPSPALHHLAAAHPA